MAAYMRGRFPFLGIPSPQRRALQREAWAGLPRPLEVELSAIARTFWALPEREYQYAACDLLAGHARRCGPETLALAGELITSKSWWDTVDALASGVAGPILAAHPELISEMDEWIVSEDVWRARSALLFQLHYRARTDAARLFRYCLLRAGDRELFIRKAIGWALREYSKTDGDAVRAFVAEHPGELSPLSRREALLWLEGGRKSGPRGGGRAASREV